MSNLRELEDGTIQKQCSKCQQWKRIPEGFTPRKQSPDGFATRCHKCIAAAKSAWIRGGSAGAARAREAMKKRVYRRGKAFSWVE